MHQLSSWYLLDDVQGHFVVYLYGLHRGQIFIEGGGDSLVAMHGLPGVNLLIGSRRELFVDVQVLPHGERLVCWSIIL